MNFYDIRELRNNTKTVLSTVSEQGTAVITDNGKPAAIMLSISEENFEEVIAMVKRIRAQRAFEEMKKKARIDFPNGMSEEEIETEITAARRGNNA